MTEPKRTGRGKPARNESRRGSNLRDGGTPVRVPNSGLEVWIYDDANRETIRSTNPPDRDSGGMPAGFERLTREGLIVGYSLCQDDEVHVAVYVGTRFTDDELSVARWLEPQRAFLRLPSGTLCVESNDASRIGSEEPGEPGAVVAVPPGDYGLTLFRIDREALDREGLTWDGPLEVVVLTPDGDPGAAATDLLPFEPRRDAAWVGRYAVRGRTADALAWFGDYWDTCVVNLDAEAIAKLGIAPGAYLRTTVADAGISLVGVLAASWDEGRRLPPPAGVELDEYGYAALCAMSDWDGAEALFWRRDRTTTCIDDRHHNVWLPAVVEVLDVAPQPLAREGVSGTRTDLRSKTYFDSSFLAFVLSDVLPGVDDFDELELADAVDRFDARFAKLGLEPQGDVAWTLRHGALEVEACCRFYTGLPTGFAVLLAGEGRFEVLLVSEVEDGSWIVTGLADEIERRIKTRGPDGLYREHPRVRLESMDESLAKIFSAHKKSLKKLKAADAPSSLDDAVAAWERFTAVAFGPLPA